MFHFELNLYVVTFIQNIKLGTIINDFI